MGHSWIWTLKSLTEEPKLVILMEQKESQNNIPYSV